MHERPINSSLTQRHVRVGRPRGVLRLSDAFGIVRVTIAVALCP